jgi:glycosyltransferase involved in cell wall biosynthesis
MAARPLRALWERWDYPPIEYWTGPVDVVHGTNFVVPPARRAARVVTVHDLTAVRFPELCTADTLRYPSLIRRAVNAGAWVHTPSAFVAREVVEAFAVSPERVRAIAHGVPEAGQIANGDIARGQRLAGGERFVLALGAIEPRKGLPLLVRAFDLIADADPDLCLVVAGPDGWGLQAFTDAVERSRHRQRIRRLSYVGAEDKAALLAAATAFAYPSLYEGFGLPPLEAMTAGVPVVATTAGALPEVLGDAAVLVPPGEVEAFADGLAEVVQEGAGCAARVERGRRTASTYSWDRCATGMLDLYGLAVRGD